MREFDELPTSEPTEIRAEHHKTKKNVGNLRNGHGGLTLFQINVNTMECSKVKFEASTIPVDEKVGPRMPGFVGDLATKSQINIKVKSVHHKVEAKEGFYYVWSLNERNALRHYRKAFRK